LREPSSTDEKGKVLAKDQINDGKEVTRPDDLGVLMKEGQPTLASRLRRSNLTHVLLNSAFGDLHAHFETFTPNAFRAPGRVVADHLFDEGDRLNIQGGTTWQHL